MDGILSKVTWKIYPLFKLYFEALKVLLINICQMSHQIFYFLLFYTSLYISRHHFSQIFRTSRNIIWKKRFSLRISFFDRFTQTPHPLNSQNPLTVTKVFCLCSLSSVECWDHCDIIKTIIVKSKVPSINYPYFAKNFKFLRQYWSFWENQVIFWF